MKILLICGSIAEKSHTKALMKYLETLFVAKNLKTEFWDLKEKSLPIALPQYHRDPLQHPDKIVKDFVTAVASADVVILGSPLYHGSFSGVLKNALDNLRGDAFLGKWAGLVGNAGSPRASHVQLVHLRHVVNTLCGYSLQTQVGTSGQDYEENDTTYVLNYEAIKERCQRLVAEAVEHIG